MTYQTEFARHEPMTVDSLTVLPPALGIGSVADVWHLRWEEHCVECAAPHCFTTCALYARRADGMCARFENGIAKNHRFPGLLDYGAEIRFKRWGKLEANLKHAFMTKPASIHELDRVEQRRMQMVRSVAPTWNKIVPIRKTNAFTLANKLRERSLENAALQGKRDVAPDEFYAEVENLGKSPVTLVLELVVSGAPRFRTSIELQPGTNAHSIPFAAFGVAPQSVFGESALLRLQPDGDVSAHIVVRWLTFVRRVVAPLAIVGAPDGSQRTASSTPASKVKAVVWDLDNTIWPGVLGDMQPDEVVVRPSVRRLIEELDARGILQSVASKNDRNHALEMLQRLNLRDYFLAPQIHWQPKSMSLLAIADALNIGVDTFAFIDDSTFERGEVSAQLPSVRVFDAAHIDGILEQPEFDVPITPESRQRRLMYRVEEQRKTAASTHAGDYLDFLKACELVARISIPSTLDERARCHELLQRTNQLNTSGKRYSKQEFDQLLADRTRLCLFVDCADRYGSYGIVGFISIAFEANTALVEDFVLSCRVAQKRVEHAVFAYLLRETAERGYGSLDLRFVASARNCIMQESLQSVGFPLTPNVVSPQIVTLPTDQPVPECDLVSIVSLPAHARDGMAAAVSQL